MTATATAKSAATHPKISERRAAVEDQNLRSRNRRLTIAGIVVLLALMAAASSQSPLLDVDEVRVIGASRTSPDHVRETAALLPGEPLLGLDLGAAEDRLLELPDIESVAASKDWDGTVTIEIVERRPVALLTTDSEAVDVIAAAADGVVVEVSDQAAAELPAVSGVMFTASPGDTVPDVLADALVVAAALPADVSRLTERIEVSVDMLALRLRGGAVIELGDARNLELKIDAIRAFFAQVELDCLEELNVQAPTVPVLVRAPSCR